MGVNNLMKKFLLFSFIIIFLINLAYGVEIISVPSLTLNDINRVGRISKHNELEIGLYSGLVNFYISYGVGNRWEFQLSGGKNCAISFLPFSVENITNVLEFVALKNIYKSDYLEINTASGIGILNGSTERYFGYISSGSLIFNLNITRFLGVSFPISLYYIGNDYGGGWNKGCVVVPGIYLVFSVKNFNFKFGYNIASYPDWDYFLNMLFQKEPFEPVRIGEVIVSPISMSFEISIKL